MPLTSILLLNRPFFACSGSFGGRAVGGLALPSCSLFAGAGRTGRCGGRAAKIIGDDIAISRERTQHADQINFSMQHRRPVTSRERIAGRITACRQGGTPLPTNRSQALMPRRSRLLRSAAPPSSGRQAPRSRFRRAKLETLSSLPFCDKPIVRTSGYFTSYLIFCSSILTVSTGYICLYKLTVRL